MSVVIDSADLDKLRSDLESAEKEIDRLCDLLADKDYIAMKARHNAGQLSWANMLDERETRAR